MRSAHAWTLALLPLLACGYVSGNLLNGIGVPPVQNQNSNGLFHKAFGGGVPQQARNFGPFDPRRLFLRRPPIGAATPVGVQQPTAVNNQQHHVPENNLGSKARSGGIPLIPAPVIPPEVHSPLGKMRQKFHIKPMGREKESRQGNHYGDEEHKDGTVPVGELADSLRHLLGLKEGGKVMINFAVNKPTEHRTARGHLYIDSSHEQLHMPEFPDPAKQFRDDPKIRAAAKSKDLLKEVEDGAPGPIWKYLMDHATPIRDGGRPHRDEQQNDAPRRPNRNNNNNGGGGGGGRNKNNNPKLNKNNKNRRPQLQDVPVTSTESPESDEKLNDGGTNGSGAGQRPEDSEPAFFDDDEDFDEDGPAPGDANAPGKHGGRPGPLADHEDGPGHFGSGQRLPGRPNKNRRPQSQQGQQQQRPFLNNHNKKNNKPGGPKLAADRPNVLPVVDDDSGPSEDPTGTVDDDEDDITPPRKKPSAFIPTAYEIHVQPVIATSTFEDSANILNSIHNDAGKKHNKNKNNNKIPEFNVPVPNFPAHVNFGNGAFRLVHETDWTPIAADAANFGFGGSKNQKNPHHGSRLPGRPVSGPGAFEPHSPHGDEEHEDPSGTAEGDSSGGPNTSDDSAPPVRGNGGRPQSSDDETGSAPEEEGGPSADYDSPTTESPSRPGYGPDDGPPPPSADQGGSAEGSGPEDGGSAPPSYEYDASNGSEEPTEYDEPYSEGEIDEIKKYFQGFPQFNNNELNEKPGAESETGGPSTVPPYADEENEGSAPSAMADDVEIPARENNDDQLPPGGNGEFNKYAGLRDNTQGPKKGRHHRDQGRENHHEQGRENPHEQGRENHHEQGRDNSPGALRFPPNIRPSGSRGNRRPSLKGGQFRDSKSVNNFHQQGPADNHEEEKPTPLQSDVHYAQAPAKDKNDGKRRNRNKQQRNFTTLTKQHRSSDVEVMKGPFKRHSTGFQQPAAVQAAIDKDKLDLQTNSTTASNETKNETTGGSNVVEGKVGIEQEPATPREADGRKTADSSTSQGGKVESSEGKTSGESSKIERRVTEEKTAEDHKVFSVKKIKLSAS